VKASGGRFAVTYVSCSCSRRPGVPGCAFRHFVRGCHARDSSTGHKQEHQHQGRFAIDIFNTQSRPRPIPPKTTTVYKVNLRDKHQFVTMLLDEDPAAVRPTQYQYQPPSSLTNKSPSSSHNAPRTSKSQTIRPLSTESTNPSAPSQNSAPSTCAPSNPLSAN
jgi:hypothetical protein